MEEFETLIKLDEINMEHHFDVFNRQRFTISKNGNLLVYFENSNIIKIYRVNDHSSLITQITVPDETELNSIKISNNERFIAIGGTNNVHIWDIFTNIFIKCKSYNEIKVNDRPYDIFEGISLNLNDESLKYTKNNFLLFSNDDKFLFVSFYNAIFIYRTDSGHHSKSFIRNVTPINKDDMTPISNFILNDENNRIAICSYNRSLQMPKKIIVRKINLESAGGGGSSGGLSSIVSIGNSIPFDESIEIDTESVVTGCYFYKNNLVSFEYDGKLSLWDIENSKILKSFVIPLPTTISLRFNDISYNEKKNIFILNYAPYILEVDPESFTIATTKYKKILVATTTRHVNSIDLSYYDGIHQLALSNNKIFTFMCIDYIYTINFYQY